MYTRLIIFDLGTLLSFERTALKTLHHVLRDAGFNLTLEEVSLAAAGKEARHAIRDLLLEFEIDPVMVGHVYQRYGLHLEATLAGQPLTLQPAALQVLAHMRRSGVKVALATHHTQATAERLLRKAGWAVDRDYHLLLTAAHMPDDGCLSTMVTGAMHHCHVFDPLTVAMVCSHVPGLVAARKARCGVIAAVTSDVHDRQALQAARPTWIMDSLDEVPHMLHLETALALAGQ